MNCVVLRGKCFGLLDSPSDKVVKFGVVQKRKDRDGNWQESVISVTSFNTRVREMLDGFDGYVTVVGQVSGREYNDRYYTEIIASDVITQAVKAKTAEPPAEPSENLDDIPF